MAKLTLEAVGACGVSCVRSGEDYRCGRRASTGTINQDGRSPARFAQQRVDGVAFRRLWGRRLLVQVPGELRAWWPSRSRRSGEPAACRRPSRSQGTRAGRAAARRSTPLSALRSRFSRARSTRTSLAPGERVEALIQATLGCGPVLVERVLVSDDIRAETTRALSAPAGLGAHAASGLLKRDANALLEVASNPLRSRRSPPPSRPTARAPARCLRRDHEANDHRCGRRPWSSVSPKAAVLQVRRHKTHYRPRRERTYSPPQNCRASRHPKPSPRFLSSRRLGQRATAPRRRVVWPYPW